VVHKNAEAISTDGYQSRGSEPYCKEQLWFHQ
jgi:hypothetical protein